MDDRAAQDLWSSFPHDPRDPALAPLRAADADRELVQQVVAEAFAVGRLDREEYDERSAAVQAARTLGDLPPLVADLVPERPRVPATSSRSLAAASSADLQRRAEAKWHKDRTEALTGFLLPTVVCWVIWSAVMFGGFPWPLFPMAATLVNLLRVQLSRRDIVETEVRRLERKQAKELKELESRDKKKPT